MKPRQYAREARVLRFVLSPSPVELESIPLQLNDAVVVRMDQEVAPLIPELKCSCNLRIETLRHRSERLRFFGARVFVSNLLPKAAQAETRHPHGVEDYAARHFGYWWPIVRRRRRDLRGLVLRQCSSTVASMNPNGKPCFCRNFSFDGRDPKKLLPGVALGQVAGENAEKCEVRPRKPPRSKAARLGSELEIVADESGHRLCASSARVRCQLHTGASVPCAVRAPLNLDVQAEAGTVLGALPRSARSASAS